MKPFIVQIQRIKLDITAQVPPVFPVHPYNICYYVSMQSFASLRSITVNYQSIDTGLKHSICILHVENHCDPEQPNLKIFLNTITSDFLIGQRPKKNSLISRFSVLIVPVSVYIHVFS